MKLLINELNILKEIETHTFIIKLHYAFRHETKVYFVFDCFLGGDLRLHLKNGHIFSEASVAYYLACIGSALYYLHLKNIMHRDVKPENIMLDHHGVPYLTDFGISYKSPNDRVALCSLSSGTMAYLAPEVLTPSHRHSFQSDFWSLGVVGYELLYGRRPFQKHCPREFVYFVENSYRYVWDRLESESCALFDWSDEGLLSCDDMNLPYPNHYIPLLPDGSLPDVLRAKYPPLLLCGAPSSEDCMDLLDSLLDVRIHKRFGIIPQYSKFSNHRWFQNQLPLDFSKKLLKLIVPPFRPDQDLVERLIADKYSKPLPNDQFENSLSPLSSPHIYSPRNPVLESPLDSAQSATSPQIFQYIVPPPLSSTEINQTHLPDDVVQQLQDFYYVSPDHHLNSATARSCSPRTDHIRLSSR